MTVESARSISFKQSETIDAERMANESETKSVELISYVLAKQLEKTENRRRKLIAK